ncbi:MAG: RNA 2',3'-cyclic phosphodiesterase, partial [Elusimicrobiales bacterium]|nr:RNA 2',3'-cyclic phosphodiesterase [Elusimicrobiales bacterium]
AESQGVELLELFRLASPKDPNLLPQSVCHIEKSILTAGDSVGKAEAAGRCLEVLSGFGPFEAAAGEAGFFPSPDRPKVFWLGFADGAARLSEAAGTLSAALRAEGFVLEERTFVPHLTLARLKGSVPPAAAVKAAAAAKELCRGARFPVTGAVLFSSELSSGGPRYSELKRIDF